MVAAVRESATRGPSVRKCARKIAAVASPPPRTIMSSMGVVTIHAPSSLTQAIWIEPAGVASVSTDVTSTVEGPPARTRETASSRSASLRTVIPDR